MQRTFLKLCQDTASESGTVSNGAPSSVVNQSGRLLKFINWVADAWDEIQTAQTEWLWLQDEFTGTLTAGTARYTSVSWNIERWAAWRRDNWESGYRPLSIYDPARGPSDEAEIFEISWQTWRARYGRGEHARNRPVEYAVSPKGELCFGPTPDAAYVVKGEYRKSPQRLTNNDDVPEMPGEYHRLIIWRALMTAHRHDEAVLNIGQVGIEYNDMMSKLVRDQLPEIHNGGDGPIA